MRVQANRPPAYGWKKLYFVLGFQDLAHQTLVPDNCVIFSQLFNFTLPGYSFWKCVFFTPRGVVFYFPNFKKAV